LLESALRGEASNHLAWTPIDAAASVELDGE
jgi:hypothetical protein